MTQTGSLVELAHNRHTELGARMGERASANEKPKRNGAASDRQLSKLQRNILMWLYEQEMDFVTVKEMKQRGHKFETAFAQDFYKLAETIKQEGVPWSAERFLTHIKNPTRSHHASLSRSLGGLENRGLVDRRDSAKGLGQKPRTTHVKLTKIGRDAAKQLSENSGMSEREAKVWNKQANESLTAFVERELPGFKGHISLRDE